MHQEKHILDVICALTWITGPSQQFDEFRVKLWIELR
jgi:hypothetical protein